MTQDMKPAVKAKAKLSKKEQRQQAHVRRRLFSRLAWGTVGLALFALLGYGAWNLLRPKPGQSLPQQARTHIQVGDAHEPYNTNPPTSGPHAGTVRADFYETAPPDENLVHNLEHGYVVIWYNCTGLDDAGCQSLKTQIQGIMDRAKPVVVASDIKKLIAVPRRTMDSLIALTSWGRIYKLSAFDEAAMLQFINEFRNKAPEPNAP